MKTVICDICGKTREQLVFEMTSINKYTKTTLFGSCVGTPKEFDICDKCLEKIKEVANKGGGTDG